MKPNGETHLDLRTDGSSCSCNGASALLVDSVEPQTDQRPNKSAADNCDSSPSRDIAKNSLVGHEARRLTREEAEKLEKDTRLVSDFKQNKLEVRK